MTSKTPYIYILRFENDKVYIGQSTSIIKRFINYKNLFCGGQPKLYNALVKYGWDSVQRELYEFPEEYLDAIEKMLIVAYNSVNEGYNCEWGGRRKGRKASRETIAKQTGEKNHNWKGGANRLCKSCNINKVHVRYNGRVESCCMDCISENTSLKYNGRKLIRKNRTGKERLICRTCGIENCYITPKGLLNSNCKNCLNQKRRKR